MINNKHLVSVGIPTYNRAESLKKAISSVISQTYSNLEIIISDNASTDETQQVCEEFCQLDSRITYVRHAENLGAINNFKFVLDKAYGEYFMWLGDDDFIDIDYISKCLYFLLDNQDYILCSGIARYFTESSNFYGEIIELNNDSFYSRITSYLNKVQYNGVFYGLYSRQKLKLIFSVCKNNNDFAGDWIIVACIAFTGKIKTLVDTCIHRKEQEKTIEDYTSIISHSNPIEAIYPYPYISINIYQSINSLTRFGHSTRYGRSLQLYLLFVEALRILSCRFGHFSGKSTSKINIFWILRKLILKLKFYCKIIVRTILNLVKDIFFNLKCLYLLSKHNKSLFEKDNKGSFPTIAWFSPIKPIQSGISSYSHEIVNSLSNYYKIFVFIDDGYEPDIDVKKNKNTIYLNHRCFWILSKLFLFKENIFQVGNSRYHTYMSRYIYKYSGLVFLHDSLSIDRISPDFISNQKNTCIVHSIHAQEQVKDKYPCSNLRVLKQPIKIPASISPQQKNLLKVKMGFNVNTFIVSFFGIISEEKLVYEVCRDFYNKLFSDIELNNIFILIIGYSITDQRLIQLINLMSSHQNTKNRILIDINVSDEKLYNYLYITDICMNLRKSSRGETSSALLRAMSCGIPSIVTDIDSFCEFPDDSVIKIPPNMEDFSNLLKQLYYNKGMLHRISQKSREYIVNNHTIQHVADEYRQLINKNRHE